MDIQPVDVLKWIGIVLAAGFVGYFGRYLAMMIIAKIHEKEAPADSPPPETKAAQINEASLKPEKKRAKQAVKQAKKAGKK